VSASKEKKTRQDPAAQGLSEREQKRLKEAQDARRSSILYGTVGIICVVAAIFLVIWNTGIIQRNATAVTINGTKYTAADAQYYFNSTRLNVLNFYYSNMGMLPFNTSISTKDQVYDSTTGQTWYDYLMGQTLDTMTLYAAATDKAHEEGYTISAETQQQLESDLAELDTAWEGTTYSSRDAYIRGTFGPYMTYDRLVELYTDTYYVQDYLDSITTGFTYTEDDYQAYYEENADSLDSFTMTQFVCLAQVSTTDEEGNAIEMTEDEKAAALEEEKAEAKALAEEIMAKLEAGEDAQSLADTYSEQLYSYDISDVRTGSNVNTSYSEWAFDPARQPGDLTLAEYDSESSSYYYYVVRFENRERDDDPTHDVRHILISPETDGDGTEATDEQKAAAKAKAEELLEQWKVGGSTEDSFAALAQTESADTVSAAEGGLISGITPTSSYVESFRDWAVDPSRKIGDTGIVESSYGYHIMYYVGDGDPVWKSTVDANLRSADYDTWETATREGYSASTGIGLKFLQV
jgi:parvulin-like peptidyl-prolyl isomerase